MRCPGCRHDNPDPARFCAACGTRLIAVCAACAAALPPGARFCPACGEAVDADAAGSRPGRAPEAYTPRHLAERILTSRAALVGERKPVTVLFCDLVDSTGLAERLGPDAMHDCLNRFFEAALGEIHRFEGTVNQFLGDGFMALFGAPLAYEDHARRAALAALAVARALGRPLVLDTGAQVTLSLRMGLNTGLVVVGAIGDNLRMDYTAVGDCTHLAARLQQAAGPGDILVSRATARLIEDHVALEAVGTLPLRGLSQPVTAYRLTGAGAGRPADADRRRPRSRFVGREREVATLREMVDEVGQGRGRVAGIVGEPGVGKSRLLLEVRSEVADRAAWIEGRCLSYGAAIPYLPVLDLLRGACGIAEVDPPERVADRVHAALEAVGLDPAERAMYLLHLLGLKTPEDAVRALGGDVLLARTHDTLRQLWLRQSRPRPLVLAVEDAHWIDPASEACLAALADSLPGARVLLITTYRPGDRPPWMDRSYATQVALAPLRRDDSVEIVHSLLPSLPADDARARVILDKAEGNPFFIEELVHALGDAPGDRLKVPDSVQGVLAARIDRLPETAKHALQTAAVLGRQFTVRLLGAIADEPGRLDDDLRDLTRREFLYEQSDGEERGYVFKHALTQDVAHASLVTPRRRALHRRAADALVALDPERVGELAPLLAHHYLEAEAWAEAAEHARRAAETARSAWANREALLRYGQALLAADRAGRPAAEREEILEARADTHAVLGQFDPARVDLEAALALAEGRRDVAAQSRVLAALGALWGGHRDYARGLDLTRQAVALVTAAGDPRARAGALAQLGVMLLNLGRMSDSRRELESALALYGELGDAWGEGRTLEILGMNGWLAGDADRAGDLVDRALDRLRAVGDRRTEISALVSLSAVRAWTTGMTAGRATLQAALDIALALEARSDETFVRCAIADFGMIFGLYADAYREATRALATARELDHLEWTAYALDSLGRSYAECGDVARARRLHEEELGIARRLGASIWIADALGNLGRDLFLSGEGGEARRHLEDAVRVAEECAEKAVLPLLTLGDVEIEAGRPEEALGVVARFRAMAGGYRTLEIDARRIEAQAWLLLGRVDQAEAALARVSVEAEAYGMWPTRWRAGLALAGLARDRPQPAEALAHAAQVVALLDAFAASLPEELAPAFRRSTLVRRAAALAAGA